MGFEIKFLNLNKNKVTNKNNNNVKNLEYKSKFLFWENLSIKNQILPGKKYFVKSSTPCFHSNPKPNILEFKANGINKNKKINNKTPNFSLRLETIRTGSTAASAVILTANKLKLEKKELKNLLECDIA